VDPRYTGLRTAFRWFAGLVAVVCLFTLVRIWLQMQRGPGLPARIEFKLETPWPAPGGIRSRTAAFLLIDDAPVLAFATRNGDVEWVSGSGEARATLLGVRAADVPFLVLDANGDRSDDLIMVSEERRILFFDGRKGLRFAETDWFAEPFTSPPAATVHRTGGALVASHSRSGKFAAYRTPDGSVYPREQYYNSRTGAPGVWFDIDGDGLEDYVVGSDDGHLVFLAGGRGVLQSIDLRAMAIAVRPGMAARAFQLRSAPAHHDYTGDGRPEVIVLTRQHDVAVFDLSTQQLVAYAALGHASTPVRTAAPGPILADLDADGVPEIIVAHQSGRLYAFRTPQVPGHPLVEHWQPVIVGPVSHVPALADLNGDRIPELVASTTRGEIAVVDGARGDLVYRTQVEARGPPLIVDADGDGRLEIVVAGDARWIVIGTDAGAGESDRWWRQWRGWPNRSGHFQTLAAPHSRPWMRAVVVAVLAAVATILWAKL